MRNSSPLIVWSPVFLADSPGKSGHCLDCSNQQLDPLFRTTKIYVRNRRAKGSAFGYNRKNSASNCSGLKRLGGSPSVIACRAMSGEQATAPDFAFTPYIPGDCGGACWSNIRIEICVASFCCLSRLDYFRVADKLSFGSPYPRDFDLYQ